MYEVSAFGMHPDFLAGMLPRDQPGPSTSPPRPSVRRVTPFCGSISAVEPRARLDGAAPDITPLITEAYAAEPISHAMISAHSFISNAKGYPVLPKTTQSLVWSLLMAVPTISFVLSPH